MAPSLAFALFPLFSLIPSHHHINSYHTNLSLKKFCSKALFQRTDSRRVTIVYWPHLCSTSSTLLLSSPPRTSLLLIVLITSLSSLYLNLSTALSFLKRFLLLAFVVTLTPELSIALKNTASPFLLLASASLSMCVCVYVCLVVSDSLWPHGW